MFISQEQTVKTTTLQDIFSAHPKSIKLPNNFMTVLIMHWTNKTNLYIIPLFEIVGVTSTEKTYYVVFTFQTSENEENFIWVLQMFLDLLNIKDKMLKVIVIERDITLMNVVATIFPKSTALLWLCLVKITDTW